MGSKRQADDVAIELRRPGCLAGVASWLSFSVFPTPSLEQNKHGKGNTGPHVMGPSSR